MKKKILIGGLMIALGSTAMAHHNYGSYQPEFTLKGGVASFVNSDYHTDGAGFILEAEVAKPVTNNLYLGIELGGLRNNYWEDYTSFYTGVFAKIMLDHHIYLKGSVGGIFAEVSDNYRWESYSVSNNTIYFGGELGYIMDSGFSIFLGAKVYEVKEEYNNYYHNYTVVWEDYETNGYLGIGYTF